MKKMLQVGAIWAFGSFGLAAYLNEGWPLIGLIGMMIHQGIIGQEYLNQEDD